MTPDLVADRLVALGLWRGDASGSAAAAGQRNMWLLIQLRWLAVAGQVVTILAVHFLMAIPLPLDLMLAAVAGLSAVNLAGLLRLRLKSTPSDGELFAALLIDVAVLTWQLYLSGGAANPFAPLFLLQVVLGAVLLGPRLTWVMVGLTSACFGLLILAHRPLAASPQMDAFGLYLRGSFVCFALIAVLLTLFITRISKNLRARDDYLAQMRQRAAEEDHIVRMGLLASGAAHELGTPLSSLSVIISDLKRMPTLRADAEALSDLGDMQAEVERCKAIVTGILLSAGEARGEAPVVTTLRAFMDDIIGDWRAAQDGVTVSYQDHIGADLAVVSDPALKQVMVNILANAAEAGARTVAVDAERQAEMLVISVTDDGPGFQPEILARFGQPYQTTKTRPGAGLGLFLLVNVLRKLGGGAKASHAAGGGARITISLPLTAIALGEEPSDGR